MDRKFVIKSNALIEARYRLSLQESQVILWLLTQIDQDDEDFKPHKLEISKFSELIGVKSGNRYTELRKITRNLMQRVMEISEEETKETLQISWLSSALYKTNQGQVILSFDPGLKPYLLQLKSHFTKIDIVDTLKLKSIYAIRIFELLLQYDKLEKRIINIFDLRAYCGIEEQEYKDYFDLKRNVIKKAKTEINSKTDYKVNYVEIKESRKVVAIEWSIKKKDPLQEENLEKLKLIQKELRSQSDLIEAFIEYGFSRAMAKRVINNNDETVTKNALKAVDIQVSKGQAKNPKAMLQIAVQEKWHPDIFKKKS